MPSTRYISQVIDPYSDILSLGNHDKDYSQSRIRSTNQAPANCLHVEGMDSGRTRRLFFALWPDDAVRHQLDKIAIQHRPEKSRAIPPANLHATLIFLGPQPESLLTDILQAAASIDGQGFNLSLQQLQVWRKPQVMCLCAEPFPDELIALHTQLRMALTEIGVETENRKYRPHVTLARKVKHAVESDQLPLSLNWPVKGFSLIESVSSDNGVRYQELAIWSFSLN